MAYEHVTTLRNDGDLQQRLIACAATEGIPAPDHWVYERMWEFATQAGWADAYHSAMLSFIDRPGLRPGAISDQMILSAVQSVRAEDPLEPEET